MTAKSSRLITMSDTLLFTTLTVVMVIRSLYITTQYCQLYYIVYIRKLDYIRDNTMILYALLFYITLLDIDYHTLIMYTQVIKIMEVKDMKVCCKNCYFYIKKTGVLFDEYVCIEKPEADLTHEGTNCPDFRPLPPRNTNR